MEGTFLDDLQDLLVEEGLDLDVTVQTPLLDVLHSLAALTLSGSHRLLQISQESLCFLHS